MTKFVRTRVWIFSGSARSPTLRAPVRGPLRWAPALPANIRLGWKCLTVTNNLAYTTQYLRVSLEAPLLEWAPQGEAPVVPENIRLG